MAFRYSDNLQQDDFLNICSVAVSSSSTQSVHRIAVLHSNNMRRVSGVLQITAPGALALQRALAHFGASDLDTRFRGLGV